MEIILRIRNTSLLLIIAAISSPFFLFAEDNYIPEIMVRRDFGFDYSFFCETAIDVLDHYSPEWSTNYPPSSPLIASINYHTDDTTEKIIIVLFEGFERGFANVIFLLGCREETEKIIELDQLDIRETLLIDFTLDDDYTYFEEKIPQLIHSYYMYNKYRDQINRDVQT